MSKNSDLNNSDALTFPRLSPGIFSYGKRGAGTATSDGAEINAAIRKHIKALSPYWFSLVQKANPTTEELSRALSISYAAAWRQIRRGSMHLGYLNLRRVTIWLLSLMPKSDLYEMDGSSLQYAWFGFDVDWPAPPLLDAFQYTVKDFSPDLLATIQKVTDSFRWPDWDGKGVLFADRMRSLHADLGTTLYNEGFKRISISRNRALVAELMGDMTEVELEEGAKSLDLALIMTLSCAIGVPLDYFCETDYFTPLKDHIVVVRNGKSQPICEDCGPQVETLLASFSCCPRESQQKILSLAIASSIK